MSDLEKAIENLISAINTEGPVPQYHQHVMRKHRAEWPALWKAIDEISAIYASDSN